MLHVQTQCTSVHVRGFTTGQKTVENRRAVTGCGPWSVGRQAAGPSRAAGPRASSANHASSKPVQIPLLSLEAEACHWPSQVILAHCSLAQWTTANFYCNTQNACKESMVAACIRLNRCFPQQV